MDGGDSPVVEVFPSLGCFPYGFCRELKELFRLAWPTSLSILFHYMIQPISLAFCGHLGKHELAAVALAISVIYITTISIGRGLAFGGDTFFAQTYGSANKKKVGVYLQKAMLFGILCSMLIWALLINTETLLLLAGQEPSVASLAQEYTQLFMPGALAYCWLFTLMRYLLCQNRVLPNLLICMVSCGICALLNYGLIYQADMGIKGSAIALMMTYYLVLIFLVTYIWLSGLYKETWAGWSWECLDDWGEFARVSLSSVFMTFIFWLCTEIGTFLAGLQGEKTLSAFSICFQVEGFAWMIPLGLGGACTARVGQFLGANEPLGALTSCRVSLTVQVFVSLFVAGLSYLLRFYIPMAFTTNEELIDYTANIMQIVSIFLLIEGFGGVGMGIVRGTGRQTLGAVIIIISWYLVALPIGIPLMFATSLGLAGLWWGYVVGLATQDVFLMAFASKINWDTEASNAQIRAGVGFTEASLNADGVSPSREHNPVDERTGLLNSVPQPSSSHAAVSESYESLGGDTRRLSRTHTVLRRLAAFLVMSLVLGGGIAARVFVKIPVEVPFTDLCIDARNDTLPRVGGPLAHSARPWNQSVPFCNDTAAGSEADWPVYPIWL